MSAIEKTKNHERTFLPISLLDANENNPNKMSSREFDLLCDNFEQMGFTDPAIVRPTKDGRYRIVGGHHRVQAAEYLDFKEVPVVIIKDEEFDDDMENFQLVRMNVIHGQMDTSAFMNLYGKMSEKYEEEILQDLFGFADEKEFQKLIKSTAAGLPDELKADFKQAAKEIKTIEDLASVLNELLSSYGDSLEYGYMIFDFNGKDSVWLRMKPAHKKAFEAIGKLCRKEKRSMDDIIGMAVQLIANDTNVEFTNILIKSTPEVLGIKSDMPTLDTVNGG